MNDHLLEILGKFANRKMIYKSITQSSEKAGKQFALLIDPDKISGKALTQLCRNAMKCKTDFIFVGGSYLSNDGFSDCIKSIKKACSLPVVLFPGSVMQIDKQADAILFLSLISGRNAELLIGKQVTAAPHLKKTGMEIIPTGYMIVESGRLTSAQYISGTLPLPRGKTDLAAHTALAGQMLGLKLIYMDAGSGAEKPVSIAMIEAVKKEISIPLIVGGGINTAAKAKAAARAGADVIVVGNSIEKNPDAIHKLAEAVHSA
jgi:putative glycerol-1-phosphate prenyltransferase